MQLWDRVVERAAEQHGYVTTRDARELDIDPTQLRLMAARGRLERVSRGVYRVSLLPRTQHDDLAEAVAWTLGRGVVSHESALVLHGISDVSPSRIQLSVLRDNHPRGAGGELYRLHRRTLHPSDVTELDDIPVTTVPAHDPRLPSRRHRPLPVAARGRPSRGRRIATAQRGRGVACRDRRSFSKHARMTSRYESSPASLRALRDRLTAAAKREGVTFGRLQQHVGVLVVTQLMASITDRTGDPLLLVKGGASLELRCGIPQSRLSKDLDTVIRGDMESVHDRLGKR